MLYHAVMFRWNPSTTSDDVAATSAALAELPAAIPEIRSYRFGSDAGINDGTFEFAVVAGFDSRDDYLVYRDHPVHRALTAEHIAPHAAERASIQFEAA
jgi:hypothetical protein